MEKQPNLIVLFIVALIVVSFVGTAVGPHSWLVGKWNSMPGQSPAGGDYRSIARADAVDAGIDPALFERQINQESGFNPNALSNKGAVGIAQIEPATAQEWGVDPHDPVASLQAAAKAMAWYQNHYGSWSKALAAYNGGSSRLDWCLQHYTDWLSCMPAETQNYVAAIGG